MELEQIFYVQGKFLDSKNKEVKPEQKGGPISINLMANNIPRIDIPRLISRIKKDDSYKNLDINAYCKGKSSQDYGENTPVQFYKI